MGNKVLLVCTSTQENVRRAVERFPNDHVFLDYELDLLCLAAEADGFRPWPNLRRLLIFPKRKQVAAAFRLWRNLVRERYSIVAVLWCLEPGRSLAKAFALMALGRRILVFNENLDCAFLSLSFLHSFLRARIASGAFAGSFLGRALLATLRHGARGIFRLAASPVRVLVLLILIADLFVGRRSRGASGGPQKGTPSS